MSDHGPVPLIVDAFTKLMASNDWTMEQAVMIGELIVAYDVLFKEPPRHRVTRPRWFFLCVAVNLKPYFGRFVESENRRNMKFLTFDQIKAQLRLDDQQALDEHDLLVLYGEAAEDTVLSLIRRNMANLVETYGRVPKQIVQAALMLVAISYQHREPASQQNMYAVPYAFDTLIKSYVRLDGAELPVDPVAYYLTDFYGRRIVTADDCYIVVIKRFD